MRHAAFIVLILATGTAVAQAPPAPTAPPAPHSVEELLREPVVRDVSLSPDGKRLAITGRLGEKRDLVAIVDIDRINESDAIRKFAIGEETWHTPLWVMWANDRRLLVGVRVGFDNSFMIAGRQVHAMDPDGGNPVVLFKDAPIGARWGLDLSQVVDLTPDQPDTVIMGAWNRDSNDLFEVNVGTGVATLLVRGRSSTLGWETEGGRPALRYDVNRRGTEVSIHGRAGDGDDDWDLIAKIRIEDLARDWEYAGDAPGLGKIFVLGRHGDSDTQNIYLYDLPTRTNGEVVAQVPGYDMSSAFSIGGEYAGAVYIEDTMTYRLQDPKLQSHWNGMRKYFQNLANVRVVEIDRAHTRMLLYVTGPQAPGDYYVYDIASKNLTFVASDKPWLEPERLAAVEMLRSPTRDGRAITSYLSRPSGRSDPLPLIVMPHGGPEMRDSVTYDPLAQGFAAQGWLVLQPNFRGSSGYGRAFAEAGHRQWAKRMQHDVTDAVDDLVKRGVADPKRIAIYGASYGGYSALSGAIETPDLYRGAVSLAGISDLREFISWVRKEDGGDSESHRYWVKAIGDPKADRDAIDRVSPRFRADEISIPILLMHGTADEIVPDEQSEMMEKALRKAGKSVRYIRFENEYHSSWSTENEVEQMNEAIGFLRPLLQ